MDEVTRVLSALEQGDAAAAAQLLPLVYDELRRLAAQKLAQAVGGKGQPHARGGDVRAGVRRSQIVERKLAVLLKGRPAPLIHAMTARRTSSNR
jgi:hypothetical protein